MQGVGETLRETILIFKALRGAGRREGEVWAKLSVTLTVRDNTSQQQLRKVRKGWEDWREEKKAKR